MSEPIPAVSEVSDPIIGRVVGHYRIEAVLDRGGMGAVYKAAHELIGKAAAVKLLRPELSSDPEMVRRFFNEAKAASAIRHPGIVEIYDFGQLDDGRAYLVMEFLDGQTLSARLEQRGRMTELEAAVISRGIAGALAAAHAKGIIHRDLKPDNVFVVPDSEMPTGERPKVLDFGIAKLADAPGTLRQTRTGAVMGTPAYMAPEQARGAGEVDLRADLYSLGCMMYEMIVGEPPFVSEGVGEVIALQLFGEVTPPRERVPEISEAFEQLVLALLDKEPANRPDSAAAVIDAIGAAIPALSDRLSRMVPAASSKAHSIVKVTPRPREARIMTPAPSPLTTGASLRPTTLGQSASESIPPPGTPVERPRRSRAPLWIGGFAVVAAAAAIAFVVLGPGSGGGSQPAAAPSPSPSPTPPAPTPASPADVAITIAIDPPDAATHATFQLDGAAVDATGGVLHLAHDGAKHQLAIAAPGFVARTVPVSGDRDQTIDVGLVAAPAPVVTTTPPVVTPPTTHKKPPHGQHKKKPGGGPLEDTL